MGVARRARLRTARYGLAVCLVAGLWASSVGSPVRAAEPTSSTQRGRSVARVALLVAARDGGDDRDTLVYTESDANSVSRVLRQVGGLEPANEVQLYRATPRRLEQALERVTRRAKEAAGAGRRVEFIFYYSGHSDEHGLLLGDEAVPYDQLRAALNAVPAEVHIAILDSCASGAFTRLKGGRRRAPFLLNSTTQVQGHAFLTSSSAEESAQESDHIGGSFFTHFLTSGLRGAADRDGDKKVTLAEAYQFAFDETLAHTQAASQGAQHAAYDIKLSGSGELVMTDLHRATGSLELAGDVEGRVWVRGQHGHLAAEVVAAGNGVPTTVALEPGRYTVTVETKRKLLEGTLVVPSSGAARLSPRDLRSIPRRRTTSRGTPISAEYVLVPVSVGLFPALSVGDNARPRIVSSSIAVLWGHAARVHGASFSTGIDIADESVRGAQTTAFASISRGTVSGAQVSMGLTWASQSTRGAQLALITNASPEVHGLQLTLGTNWSRSTRGAQLGLLNISRDHIRGTQLGLLNIGGHVRGAQVGLFNFARSSQASVGLVSITREGSIHPEVWTSDTAGLNAGVRFAARYSYSFVSAGFHPAGSGAGWLMGGGFGGHIPLGNRAAIDLDLGGHVAFVDRRFGVPPALLAQARLMFAWSFAPRLTLWGGPTFNVWHDDPSDGLARPGYGYTLWSRQDSEGDDRLQLWPGFALGFRM